jgi:hypothetical protein
MPDEPTLSFRGKEVKAMVRTVVSQFEIQRFGGQNEFKSAGKSGWGNG